MTGRSGRRSSDAPPNPWRTRRTASCADCWGWTMPRGGRRSATRATVALAVRDNAPWPCEGCAIAFPAAGLARYDKRGTGILMWCDACLGARAVLFFPVLADVTRLDGYYRRTYGIGFVQYGRMYLRQKGLCAICRGVPPAGRPLFVDHDHADGRVRGLLCDHCNRGIGYLRDNPRSLQRAARYVTRRASAAAPASAGSNG